MGFPTSAFSKAAITNGQTSDPADVNDVYTELTNITDGIINGGAPIHTSNTVVNNFSAVNSTIAGTLTVSSAATFAVRPVTPPPDMALVYLESTVTCSSVVNSTTTVSYTAESILTNSSLHSTGTNPERLTPQSTGVYRFATQIALAGALSAATIIRARVVDSSGTLIGASDLAGISHAGVVQCQGIKRFDVVGSYATVQLQNVSGGSTLSLSSGVGQNWFSMVKL